MEFVKSAILSVVPDLSANDVQLAAEAIVGVGITCAADLKFVEREDLSMLMPLAGRKLLRHWQGGVTGEQTATNCNVVESPVSKAGPSKPAETICSTVLDVNNSPNWSREYVVNWNDMPKPLMRMLKDGKRPSPSLRREMIRLVADDILRIRKRPGKQQLGHIASQIMAKYPISFKDIIDNRTVGSGFDSLLKQLSSRIENKNRSTPDQIKNLVKRRINTAEQPEQPEKPAKRRLTDSYGCVNYEPLDFPDGEDEESLQLIKQTMKDAFVRGDVSCNVSDSLRKTYILQRREVLSGISILELKSEWPFIFTDVGMSVTCEELIGIDIRSTLTQSLESKSNRILKFLQDQTRKELRQLSVDLGVAKQILGNNLPDLPGLVLLLMSYFGERSDILLLQMESSATKADATKLDLPSTPTLIACGDTLLTACRFMLVLDGCVVNDNIQSFLIGLYMLFGSYFVCNIHYPIGAAATLDFIQRCLFGINPDRGSKVEHKKNKKQHTTIHPKVLTLINNLADYEWTE